MHPTEELIEKVVREFNYEKCLLLMKASGHQWVCRDRPGSEYPSIERMKESLADILRDLLVKFEGEECGFGGFKVAIRDGKLRVWFITSFTQEFEMEPLGRV
jgi:hypothetical protein